MIADSKLTSTAVIRMVITESREEENNLKTELLAQNIKVTAIDFGGDFVTSVSKIIERAIMIAERDGIIDDSHSEEGAVAGAAREAVSQISQKAMGLNVGGKIAVARYADHIAVALYFGIGMLNLNEISIGLGHRAV